MNNLSAQCLALPVKVLPPIQCLMDYSRWNRVVFLFLVYIIYILHDYDDDGDDNDDDVNNHLFLWLLVPIPSHSRLVVFSPHSALEISSIHVSSEVMDTSHILFNNCYVYTYMKYIHYFPPLLLIFPYVCLLTSIVSLFWCSLLFTCLFIHTHFYCRLIFHRIQVRPLPCLVTPSLSKCLLNFVQFGFVKLVT